MITILDHEIDNIYSTATLDCYILDGINYCIRYRHCEVGSGGSSVSQYLEDYPNDIVFLPNWTSLILGHIDTAGVG